MADTHTHACTGTQRRAPSTCTARGWKNTETVTGSKSMRVSSNNGLKVAHRGKDRSRETCRRRVTGKILMATFP